MDDNARTELRASCTRELSGLDDATVSSCSAGDALGMSPQFGD